MAIKHGRKPSHRRVKGPVHRKQANKKRLKTLESRPKAARPAPEELENEEILEDDLFDGIEEDNYDEDSGEQW